MRAGRYESIGHRAFPRWPFAVPDGYPEMPIAPEFRVSLERILQTSRSYLQIAPGRSGRPGRRSRR